MNLSRSPVPAVRLERPADAAGWRWRAEPAREVALRATIAGWQVEQLSTRIQARAIRRCGELLKQIAPKQGERSDQPRGGAPLKSRTAAASRAGLSRDQQRTALRVASIPKARFEREVESDDPPTVTKLAEMGKLPKWAER